MNIPIFTGKYHQKWWTFHGYVSFREGTLFATEKSCLCCFSRLKKVSLFFLAKSFAAKPAVVMSTCSSSGPSQRTCLADSKKKHHSVRYFWKQINKTHTLLSLLLLETGLHFSNQNRSTYFHHHLHPVFGQQKKLTPFFFL